MMSSELAWEKLKEWTKNTSLINHCRAVQITMEAAASKAGIDEPEKTKWSLCGLLHDADYEQWPEEHPKIIVEWLKAQGEAEIAHAVAAHNTLSGVEAVSLMDKTLLSIDELTGFVVACCLVRPDGIATLAASSVKKKLKDKSFAAKVNRQDIYDGAKLLNVELGEHIQFVVDALKPFAKELGIEGKG